MNGIQRRRFASRVVAEEDANRRGESHGHGNRRQGREYYCLAERADDVRRPQLVAGEIDRYTIEKRILRKHGGQFWAEVASSSVRDATGRFLYAVRVQHDITSRKLTEQALARRTEEQAALFRFSDKLQQVASFPEVYEAALDAVVRALDCERASILLFDESCVMRFVAWRGLSDRYRKAAEGHSPWSRDEKNPQPIYSGNIAGSDLSEALKQAIGRETIGAVAFIPILVNNQLAGKFVAYYDGEHRFSEPEVEVALTLARQLGFGIARLKAEDARRTAEQIIMVPRVAGG